MIFYYVIPAGIMSALDVTKQLDDMNVSSDQSGVWVLCMLGPFTVILSQKILFESRKMGTFWEESGKPNFHPTVYNMGGPYRDPPVADEPPPVTDTAGWMAGPLFVWGWFFFLMGTCSLPNKYVPTNIFVQTAGGPYWIPFFLNIRTLLSFLGGCAMVPVVGFLDFSHDEDGPWCGENDETPKAIFGKWWLGTDGTYFGLFLESPWPFVLAWSLFGFSSFFLVDDSVSVGWQQILVRVEHAVHIW